MQHIDFARVTFTALIGTLLVTAATLALLG